MYPFQVMSLSLQYKRTLDVDVGQLINRIRKVIGSIDLHNKLTKNTSTVNQSKDFLGYHYTQLFYLQYFPHMFVFDWL